MFVLTIDQRGSRRVGDRVEDLLAHLTGALGVRPGTPGLRLPFDRTVGDEVQAVVADAALVWRIARGVLRLGGWSVGIGAGAVEEPLPEQSRAASGPAFIHARAAVERAKLRSRAVPLAVVGDDARAAAEAEAVLTLLGAVAARRSPAGWQVVDLLAADGGRVRQEDVARALGITQQAVSQRVRSAMWHEELAALPLAHRLLEEAAGGGTAPGVRQAADRREGAGGREAADRGGATGRNVG